MSIELVIIVGLAVAVPVGILVTALAALMSERWQR